jgi:aryl-alcohol dehydrogenase-like predicted oxidoreductase
VETEYAALYERIGLGTTTWSPLASGLLTGKYNDGVPEGARATLPGMEWLRPMLTDPSRLVVVKRLGKVASDLGVPLSQLAIAWCLKNPRVSTVILGASRTSQLQENLGALAVVPKLTDDVMRAIDAALAG